MSRILTLYILSHDQPLTCLVGGCLVGGIIFLSKIMNFL